MSTQFNGKVALVTGGASGIGRATALAFAQHGAKVVVADMDEAGGNETVTLARAANTDALFVRTDVSQYSQVQALIAAAVEQFGRLDFAFNNAGIAGKQALLAEYPEESWDRVIDINLKGVWLCMKYELQQMLKQGGGAIVNNSSTAGQSGSRGVAAYVASKHGVVGLTKAAALEYARNNIRVNAILPGTIHTPLIDTFTGGDERILNQFVEAEPIGRLGRPEEAANAVIWLCSEGASFVTGAALAVDGGRLA
ncbi:MAG: SDR family oxidoreductase [Candidatus Viridilinea halotolerans]|uniref:SDR family oxidoreductase n=1 Tax=Candidatus Viridilinea halotolerans TaxID=2491704 RepID=A0A426U2U7_9CHLR|nr:MAG: SDR family oxidoreductase [Candidatus Viridilinea halotolerans]